jgi:hypothetical protein
MVFVTPAGPARGGGLRLVLLLGCSFGFRNLHGTPADVQRPPSIAAYSGYFSCCELGSIWMHNVSRDAFETGLDNLHQLVVRVAREGDSRKTWVTRSALSNAHLQKTGDQGLANCNARVPCGGPPQQ